MNKEDHDPSTVREIAYTKDINHPRDDKRCNRCWIGVLSGDKTSECYDYCEYDDCKLSHTGHNM